MTAPAPDKRTARANAVAFALGQLERACMSYAEQRPVRGDHWCSRELQALCLAYGQALLLDGCPERPSA